MSIPPTIELDEMVREMALQLPEASQWKSYENCAPRLRFSATIDGSQVRMHAVPVRHAHFFRHAVDNAVRIGACQGELQLRVTSSNYTPETYGRLHAALLQVQMARGLLNPWFHASLDRELLDLMHHAGHRDRKDRCAALEALKIKFYGRPDVAPDKHQRLVAMLDDYTAWRRGVRPKARPIKTPRETRFLGSGSLRTPPLLSGKRVKVTPEARGPGRPSGPRVQAAEPKRRLRVWEQDRLWAECEPRRGRGPDLLEIWARRRSGAVQGKGGGRGQASFQEGDA